MYIEYYYMNDKTIHRSKKFDSIINYNNIEILCCYNNSLNHLPNLPSNLIKLNCNYNNLISLRKININLKDFDYLNNFIKFVKFINKLHKKISFIKTTYYYI